MPTKREQFVQTVRAQFLGERMRALREERGLTLKYVAEYLGVEFSTLARYERAEWPFRREHVSALLDVYGVHDQAKRTQLVDLAQEAWRISQWQQVYGAYDPVDDAEGTVIDPWWLQCRAEELCIYAAALVPDLVQTREYADTAVRAVEKDGLRADNVVRQVIARQQVLEDKKPPTRLTIVVEEPVLSRPVGGRLVLQQQLEHLTRMVERPHVNVRVLPTQVGWHPGVNGAFLLCRMARPYPPVAVVEHLGGRLILEADAADRYAAAFDKLTEVALDPARSAEMIGQAAAKLAGSRSAQPTDELAGQGVAA
ncbi:helix-turn-helix domain-containing protein [Phytohabitans rumicis]|uniref:Transcriptional regulator n=2 Tax=Phytohabitans rumicis TaxID=1076125 RepID=A0A6V8KQU9_9ACTN|nr:helix-turn-helix transcriptional regulator [Phytohabitans rumicis]GFJ87552.1 transcriptional regulator [Phytohabitans rumicis]